MVGRFRLWLHNKLSFVVRKDVKSILYKLLWLVAIIVLFRFLAVIPVPGIPFGSLKSLLEQFSFGEVMSMVSAGVLGDTSLIAVGLNPYINASVVMQLLTTLIPKLQEMQKEGIKGRMVINMYTRLITVPFAVLQAVSVYVLLTQYGVIGSLPVEDILILVASLTGGAILLMWVSELITEGGMVNGSSFLIAVGILADIPGKLIANASKVDPNTLYAMIGFILFLAGVIVFITLAERRITIKYATRVVLGGKKENYIPLKLNQSGVMPVIFALSILATPQMIIGLLLKLSISPEIKGYLRLVNNFLSNDVYYNILLFVFIVIFSVFYTFVVFNPKEIAENLQKRGAFIPSVRPGKETSEYLLKASIRLGIVGSIFLATIAIIPRLLVQYGGIAVVLFSGTGLLIVINVAIDMQRRIKSMIVENYALDNL